MNITKININENTQFAILGLGKFGRSIAFELENFKRHVFCCDKDEQTVQKLSSKINHIVEADASNDDFLDSIEIGNFDVVIVSYGRNFEESVLTVLKLKERNVPLIIAKTSDEKHKIVLERIGADIVILPEVVMGERLGNALLYNDPISIIKESENFNIFRMFPESHWINKSLSHLKLTKKEHINVLGIIRNESLVDQITPNTIIEKNDVLIVIKNEGLSKK